MPRKWLVARARERSGSRLQRIELGGCLTHVSRLVGWRPEGAAVGDARLPGGPRAGDATAESIAAATRSVAALSSGSWTLGQHFLPQRQHHPARVEHAQRAREEPHMEVRSAVSPAVQVDPGCPAEGEDGPLDFGRDPAKVSGRGRRKIREGVSVVRRGEPDNTRQARADRRMLRPEAVGPHRRRNRVRADGIRFPARLPAARGSGMTRFARLQPAGRSGAAPWRSSWRPSGVRKIGPSLRTPMVKSTAQAVRGASGMVTTLPPLRVTTSVWCPRSIPRASMLAPVASDTRSPLSASNEISACSPGGPSPAATSRILFPVSASWPLQESTATSADTGGRAAW